MTKELAISFLNHDGQTLHGVLHLPDARVNTPIGVVLLSPGQKSRIGPWRAYVRLARRLADMGVPVLRFDFHGLGDSEGSHRHGQSLVDLNGFVQTGGLSRDVIAATEFFASQAGVTRFIFAALCGGASTGLIASQHIPGVYGQVLVDLPVTVSSSARQRYLEQNAAEMLRLRPEESHGVLRGYIERLGNIEAWKRLLSGESDYALLMESAKRVALRRAEAVRDKLPSWLRAPKREEPAPTAAAMKTPEKTGRAIAVDEQVNDAVIDAFKVAVARKHKLFFLNSSAYHPMFERYFGQTHLANHESMSGIGLLAVPETNHVLSAEHGQRALFETVEEFVRNAIAELADRPSALRISSHAIASPRI